MEKLSRKLKQSSIITLILGILSLTWLVLDYLALKEIWLKKAEAHNFEWIIVGTSALPLAAFYISVFFTLYLTFRFRMKYNSEKKREEKKTLKEDETDNNTRLEN